MIKTLKRKVKKAAPSLFVFLKKYVDMVELNFNAGCGRQFIPYPRETINIETSSICNLLCKFCNYWKKVGDKVVMPMNAFQHLVEQAVDMGYSKITFTPISGEVFMDKGIIEKMQYMEGHPGINGYIFFTNFIVPSREKIDMLFELRKLESMHISLYGHDETSFCRITQRPKKQYDRLVENLRHLYELYDKKSPFNLLMNFRTTPDFSPEQTAGSELQEIVWDFRDTHKIKVENILLYNNWGGLITGEDVKDIGLKVNDGSHVYKRGACKLVLYRPMILANGRVNACACRGIDGSLIIGDIKKNPLSYILSIKNPLYRDLIQEQTGNKFRTGCKSCDFYRSIYKKPKSNQTYYNLEQILRLLS